MLDKGDAAARDQTEVGTRAALQLLVRTEGDDVLRRKNLKSQAEFLDAIYFV